jgi:hypothetical protein
MKYVPWSDQDRFGSDRFGSDRFGSDRFGSDLGSDRFGSDQFGSDRFGSDLGSDRFGSDRFSVLCVIIGKSPYPGNIPSIPDYPRYRIIVACTVMVQLPMRVSHGMCHGRAPSGNDQLPKVVLHNY